MATDKSPLRRLDMTKLDRIELDNLLKDHVIGIEQTLEDLAIALGQAVGHVKLAAALKARINDESVTRGTTNGRLLHAISTAVSQRAERG